MHRPCTSTASATPTFRTCCFDELRTRLRCSQHVLWLWLVIDPCTRDSSRPPSGYPDTTHGTYGYPFSATDPGSWLHSALHQRWLKHVLLCFDSSFWDMAARETTRAQRAPVAGGGGLDLRPGEKKLSAASAGSRHARDASGDKGRSRGRTAGTRPLRTTQHRFY
jgi:hypothetical protein